MKKFSGSCLFSTLEASPNSRITLSQEGTLQKSTHSPEQGKYPTYFTARGPFTPPAGLRPSQPLTTAAAGPWHPAATPVPAGPAPLRRSRAAPG